jgi:DNA polymerase phi
MSKKRPREAVTPDTRLIEIYEDLANEDEEIRLKAAYVLLTQFSTKNTTIEQQKTVLKRLFRGLCSGRKAARLGFSVALTEFLSQLFLPHVEEQEIKASDIIDLLESETTVDGSTSGQVSPLFWFVCFQDLIILGRT